MINKKIALSALTIVISLSLMAGATYAFFTDTAESQNNQLATGNLEITVNQDGIFEQTSPITNWQPAEERFVRFDVINSGTLPVHLRAFALGTWLGDPVLDESLVQVINVEYWNGSGWQSITGNNDPEGITGIVYFSSNGNDQGTSNIAVPVGDTQEFRLTVKLDETAGNQYEGQFFNSSVQVHAKQVTTGAEWPTI